MSLTNLVPFATARINAILRVGSAAIIALALAGCETIITPTLVPNAVTGENPADIKYFRSDEPVKLGVQRFYEGHYGLAQQYFQNAVEVTPKDATAWLGLAASYDRLGRFDLADRSYARVVRLVGNTPNVMNNQGYSYMLRGDLLKARAKFEAALTVDPGNATALNNLELLSQGASFVQGIQD